MKLPKLILTDIDGVWTDGGMYYDETGNEWKKFNTSDSAGVLFCNQLNIEVGIITGEDTDIVSRRAKKLKIDLVKQGVKDKLSLVRQLCEDRNITLSEVAYIGDDIGDMSLLKEVGWSASPGNAPEYVKKLTRYTTKKLGGDGAFREFVEWIIVQEMPLDLILEKLMK